MGEYTDKTASQTYSGYTRQDRSSVFGGEDDLWGASEVTTQQLKDPNFTVAFDVDEGAGLLRVDSVKVEIFFKKFMASTTTQEILNEYQQDTVYAEGEQVWAIASDGYTRIYTATAGTSGSSLPVFPNANGSTVEDNDITWTESGLYSPAALPPYWNSELLDATIGVGVNGARTFVVVGRQGKIKTSLDGDAWTERSSGVGEALRGVAAGPDGFIAVGDNGVILSSIDGQEWNQEASGTFETFFSVDYDKANNGFTAVGQEGVVRRKRKDQPWEKIDNI
jgi:hypothetical protein